MCAQKCEITSYKYLMVFIVLVLPAYIPITIVIILLNRKTMIFNLHVTKLLQGRNLPLCGW